jgi:hypothetical protein
MKCYACGFIGPSSKKEGTAYGEYFDSFSYAYRGNSCHLGLVYDGSFYSCPKCGTHKSYVESDSLKINGGEKE